MEIMNDKDTQCGQGGKRRSTGCSVPSSTANSSVQYRSAYYVFLVVMLVALSALGSFVNSMYSPTLPDMCRFFNCDVPLAQLGLTTGMAGLGIGQLLLGPVSDKIGRKPVLIGATALFIAAALLSTLSSSIHIFNLCRFFQGLGASSGYLLAKVIPADVYGGRALARLMALVGAINGLAPAIAPVAGGVIADAWGWKSIFVILAAFATIVILMSLKMKETLPASAKRTGSISAAFVGYFTLLRNSRFMTLCILKAFALGLLFAFVSSAPFIAQTHYGLTQTQYGLCVGAISLFSGGGSLFSLKFRPYQRAAFAGALIMGLGVACLAVSLYSIENLWLYFVCEAVIMFGAGMIFSTSNTLAMNEGREHSGEAAALIGVTGYVVGGIASPLVGVGNIMHSTACVSVILVAGALFVALHTKQIADGF